MQQELVIRLACASDNDAQVLRLLEHNALGDSCYTTEQLCGLLQLHGHYCYLAWIGTKPAGFCSCIETHFEPGRQLEVDLLGVLQEYRGRGIATRMITTACEAARERGIRRLRAVVAEDNSASQKAFARAGFRRSRVPVNLLVYRTAFRQPVENHAEGSSLALLPVAPETYRGGASLPFTARYLLDGACVASAECQFVRTLLYTGVWLERLHGTEEFIIHLLRALVVWAAKHSLDEIGIVCTNSACPGPGQYESLWRAGFESLGHYYGYTLDI